MAWIALQDTIWTHWKTIRVCEELEIADVHAVGCLVSLWHFTLMHRPEDGDLSNWSDASIERASRWEGQRGAFVSALRGAAFLDGSKIHNWEEHALHYQFTLERKERNLEQTRERVRAFRARKTHSSAPVTESNAATVHNNTSQDITPPNHTETALRAVPE